MIDFESISRDPEQLNGMSEDDKLLSVQKEGMLVSYIKKPSETIQLAAVKEDGHALRYIKNPSEAVKLAAVQQDGCSVHFISNPSEEIQMEAIKSDDEGIAISLINNPTPSVMFDAFKRFPSNKILSFLNIDSLDDNEKKIVNKLKLKHGLYYEESDKQVSSVDWTKSIRTVGHDIDDMAVYVDDVFKKEGFVSIAVNYDAHPIRSYEAFFTDYYCVDYYTGKPLNFFMEEEFTIINNE